MNYSWVETLVMCAIFLTAASFAIKHFLPEFYVDVRRLFAGKNKRAIDVNLVAATSAGSCQTKCSACNGCSMATK